MVCTVTGSEVMQIVFSMKSRVEIMETLYRKVADKSQAYKHISRFLHQASMQTRLVCKPCLYAPLIFLYARTPGAVAYLMEIGAGQK